MRRSRTLLLGQDPSIGGGPAGFSMGPTFLPFFFSARALSQASVGSSFVRAHVLVRALQQFGVCSGEGFVQGVGEPGCP